MTWMKHPRLIARTELRRRWRTIRDNTIQVAAFAFLLLLFVPFSLGGLVGAYFAGGLVAGGELDQILEWSRTGFVSVWVGVAAFGGYRAYAVALRPDNLDGLLTTVSHRDVITGLVLTELTLWSALGLTAGSAVTVAFAIGAGSLLTVPTVLFTLCLVLLTGLPTGFLLALGVRNAGVRSVLLSRLRTLFAALLAIGYVAVIFTNSFASVFEPLSRILGPTPIAWFGDLALVGLGVGASLLRAVGSVVFSAVFVPLAGVALFRLSASLWYADGIHVTHEEDRSEAGSSRVAGLSAVLSQPVLGVVTADWKRARRSPISLSFALYPLIVLVGPLITAVQTRTVGTGLPLLVLIAGAWVTGSLFALNVLGHEGAALPVTLLSETPERSLLVGHVVAGALPVVPVAVAATVVTGLLSPYSPLVVASLGLSALVLSAGSGAIAAGVGVTFPRFETVRVSRSTRAIVPSSFAFAIYSAGVLVVSLPAVAAHSGLVGHALASFVGVDRFVVGLAGTLVSTLLVGLVGAASLLRARSGVREYHFG
jgi:hypothetical protein